MKNTIFIVLLFSFFSLLSCTKKDDATTNSTSTVTNTVTKGNWRITYYWDTDHEETNNFLGYSFTFKTNGTVTASKGTNSLTGTWSTGNDDSNAKLILSFPSPNDFLEISDDWQVLERTDIKIKLQDVSGGNGGTDYLTFEKN